jgi:hypothetical protein
MRIQRILSLAALFIAPQLCWSQTAKREVNLSATEAAQIPVSTSLIMMAATCDQEGNTYTQPFARDTTGRSEFYRAPIQRIAPGSTSSSFFRFDDAFPEGAEGRAFSVHEGRAYVLASAKRGVYVVEFAKDGSIRAKTRLAIDFLFVPFHLAVFKSGEYLVVGITGTVGPTAPHFRTPFTAVFGTNGQLVKRISEQEDEDAQQHAEGGDTKYLRCCSGSGNEFVGWNADAAPGSDGNVYLLHGTSPPLIYVISPKGEVVHKLQIDPGRDELTANSVKFYAGHLAIGFDWLGDMPQSLIKVIDTNGNLVSDYEIHEGPKDSDPILACYNAGGFTLLPRGADGNLRLLTAKLP